MGAPECFVIMPFGDKVDAEGTVLEFDKILDYLIAPAVKAAGLDCVRCDRIGEAGSIHAKMIEHIHQAAVAVVDLSALNPNVFYELGVRHALRPSVTILIRHRKTRLPFNLNGMNVIEYDPADLQSVDETKSRITDFIRKGLKSNKCDSLVHQVLPLRIGTASKAIGKSENFAYVLAGQPDKRLCITTGDILKIKGVDVWVNSENTQMQMARFYDGSISGVIRYYGAERNAAGRVTRDGIADELSELVGAHNTVPPAHVIPTDPGQLAKSHRVRKIFHVASVSGSVGKGYVPIPNLADCITNALDLADSPDLQPLQLQSILFPLLGAGTARGDLATLVAPLIEAALNHLQANPDNPIRRVHFMAYNEAELAACRSVMDNLPDLSVAPAVT